MKKNKRLKITIGLLVIIGIGISYWQYSKYQKAYQKEQEKKLEYAIPDWIYSKPKEILSIQYFGLNKKNMLVQFGKLTKDDKQGNRKQGSEIILKSSSHPDFSQKYLIQEDSKIRSQAYSGKEAMADYYELIVYKINGTKLDHYKTISLIEKIQNYKKGWEPINHSGIYLYNGQEFIRVGIRQIETDETAEIYFNIETEEIASNIEIADKPTEYSFFTNTTFKDKINIPDVYYDFNINAVVLFKYETEDLSKAYIAEVYPEIASTLKGNERTEIHMYEENDAETIAKLLVPKDENPYEGVTLTGSNSTDKEDHEIHSIAEFVQWFSWFSKEEREEILNKQ